MKAQLITLLPAQVKTLAELAEKHVGPAHITQYPSKLIEVEYEFPFRYVIAANGRAILESVP